MNHQGLIGTGVEEINFHCINAKGIKMQCLPCSTKKTHELNEEKEKHLKEQKAIDKKKKEEEKQKRKEEREINKKLKEEGKEVPKSVKRKKSSEDPKSDNENSSPSKKQKLKKSNSGSHELAKVIVEPDEAIYQYNQNRLRMEAVCPRCEKKISSFVKFEDSPEEVKEKFGPLRKNIEKK